MLSIILNRYGQNIIKQKKEIRGYIKLNVKYLFYISYLGKLIKIEELEKVRAVDVPLMLYDDALSNYSGKYATCVHLFNCKVGLLKEARELMVKNLRDVFDGIDIINSLIQYFENGLKEEDISRLSAKENTYFLVADSSGQYDDLVSNLQILEQYQRYIDNRLGQYADDEGMICDISGKATEYVIKKHSQIFKGGQNPRIVTRKTYDNYYAGAKEKFINCISAESELNINAAAKIINSKKISAKGTREYYFSSFDEEEPINVFSLDIREKRKYIDSDYFFIEYNTANIGRVSTYKAEIIPRIKAKKIIEKFTIWQECSRLQNEDRFLFSLPSVYNIASLNPHGTDEEYDRLYHEYADCIITSNYQKLVEKIYLPNMYFFAETSNRLSLFIHCLKEEIMTLEIETNSMNAEILAGRLLARANIIEKRMQYEESQENESLGYVEREINNFRRRPLQTWLKIRERIRNCETAKSYTLKKSYERMTILFSELSDLVDLTQLVNMSSLVLVGYDLETEEYWGEMRRKNND